MPLLSVIKRGREQAKEQKAQDVAKVKEETPKPPYKHIPTHAAIDAMSGAPNTFKEIDRAKILEQNRRRCAMATNGSGTESMPRLRSSLSFVSYPPPRATPVISRSGSSSTMPIHLRTRASMGATYPSYSSNLKGKEREGVSLLPNGTPIPVLATEERGMLMAKGRSHADSGENSSVSDDDLEMKNLPRYSISRTPYSAEASSNMPPQNSKGRENSKYLCPTPQHKSARHSQGERSRQNLTPRTRTRFTEPKPMDLHVFSGGLVRDSSSATLEYVRNDQSYASSSASETAPNSSAPTSLASTPDPSTAVAYFPSEMALSQKLPTSDTTTKFLATVSSDKSVDTPGEEPQKVVTELETPPDGTLQSERPSEITTTMTIRNGDKMDQKKTLPKTITPVASIKSSNKRKWGWRRSKIVSGDNLVASH